MAIRYYDVFPFITSWAQSNNNTSFESRKGMLPFPVERYTKLYTYGDVVKNNHGVIQGCFPTPSLSIFSDSVMEVKSCAAGTVTSIFDVDGKVALFIRHGDYFSTYAYLDTVFVKKGDLIRSQQLIGQVSKADNGELYELEVMFSDKQGNGIDPYPWFSKTGIFDFLKHK